MVTIVGFLAQAIKGKPIDGSDCKTLDAARKELGRLRRVTGKVVQVLSSASDLNAQNGNIIAPAPQDSDTQVRKKKAKHRKALTIDQSFKVYKKVIVEKSSEHRALIKSAITGNALFKDFLDAELEDFIDVFTPEKFYGGSTVIKQGDIGDKFYVVLKGALDIFINMDNIEQQQVETPVGVPYRRGGAFGELALLFESPHVATVRASEETILWAITRMAYKGLQLQIEQTAHLLKLDQLQSVKIGNNLLRDVMDLSQVEAMAMATQSQKFEAGSTIVKEGENGDTFYIITKGKVDVFKKSAGSKKIISLGVNSFFGEKALLSADTRQATCIAATNTECLTLSRDDFGVMLGDLNDLLSGRRVSMRTRSMEISPLNNSIIVEEMEECTLKFSDLKIKRVLGEGAFGKVNLVKSKTDGRLYALKAQGKANVIQNGSKDKLITEYQLMRELSHPFIVECYKAYQDKKYIFFLMALLPGGEVLDLLEEYEKFPESWTRFYCGTVVSVYDYMHKQKIAYRDLKPENVVLDQDGYCYLVDLGIAKKCDKGKTWTMCGTPDYLAPEIVKGQGHDWGVDYWALGVLLYELCHGFPPFYDDNPTNTAKKVMEGVYDIPPNFSRMLIDLISRLLTHQSKRLGRTRGGVRKIRQHPWFDGFDWQALLNREMKVPWVPKIKNLEKLGTKDDGKWDAPDSNWNPQLD